MKLRVGDKIEYTCDFTEKKHIGYVEGIRIEDGQEICYSGQHRTHVKNCRVIERDGEKITGLGLSKRELINNPYQGAPLWLVDIMLSIDEFLVVVWRVDAEAEGCLPGRRCFLSTEVIRRSIPIDGKAFGGAYMHALNFVKKFKPNPLAAVAEYRDKGYEGSNLSRELIYVDPDFVPQAQHYGRTFTALDVANVMVINGFTFQDADRVRVALGNIK